VLLLVLVAAVLGIECHALLDLFDGVVNRLDGVDAVARWPPLSSLA